MLAARPISPAAAPPRWWPGARAARYAGSPKARVQVMLLAEGRVCVRQSSADTSSLHAWTFPFVHPLDQSLGTGQPLLSLVCSRVVDLCTPVHGRKFIPFNAGTSSHILAIRPLSPFHKESKERWCRPTSFSLLSLLTNRLHAPFSSGLWRRPLTHYAPFVSNPPRLSSSDQPTFPRHTRT